MDDCSRCDTLWREFNEVAVVYRSVYGDDGAHSREAAETTGEERGRVCVVSVEEEGKQWGKKGS